MKEGLGAWPRHWCSKAQLNGAPPAASLGIVATALCAPHTILLPFSRRPSCPPGHRIGPVVPAGPVIAPNAPNTVTVPGMQVPRPGQQSPSPVQPEEACFPGRRCASWGLFLAMRESMKPLHRTDRNRGEQKWPGGSLMASETLVPVLETRRAGLEQEGLSSLCPKLELFNK